MTSISDRKLLLLKKVLRWVWLTLAVVVLLFYFVSPASFTATAIQAFLGENATSILIFYVIGSSIRALFLLPSTIFVVLGIALYPENPFFVLLISLVGIQIGATLMYYSASFLTPSTLFGKTSSKVQMVEEKMETYGFWIVLLWSFFPAVPTDLICFVAGSTSYSYWKFFLAVLLGELVLVSVYVFTGVELMELLF
ncbi:MAG: VTT domain-containing protein [Flavobacteriales bacterium]|jgi:uncharacterized membrane protein YdjX (TVP38/TMEM64 family)|nr:VTT domain-containing protein [Flavobacteriales bacterium]